MAAGTGTATETKPSDNVEDHIQFERDGHVTRVWLNRPWQRNSVLDGLRADYIGSSTAHSVAEASARSPFRMRPTKATIDQSLDASIPSLMAMERLAAGATLNSDDAEPARGERLPGEARPQLDRLLTQSGPR